MAGQSYERHSDSTAPVGDVQPQQPQHSSSTYQRAQENASAFSKKVADFASAGFAYVKAYFLKAILFVILAAAIILMVTMLLNACKASLLNPTPLLAVLANMINAAAPSAGAAVAFGTMAAAGVVGTLAAVGLCSNKPTYALDANNNYIYKQNESNDGFFTKLGNRFFAMHKGSVIVNNIQFKKLNAFNDDVNAETNNITLGSSSSN